MAIASASLSYIHAPFPSPVSLSHTQGFTHASFILDVILILALKAYGRSSGLFNIVGSFSPRELCYQIYESCLLSLLYILSIFFIALLSLSPFAIFKIGFAIALLSLTCVFLLTLFVSLDLTWFSLLEYQKSFQRNSQFPAHFVLFSSSSIPVFAVLGSISHSRSIYYSGFCVLGFYFWGALR